MVGGSRLSDCGELDAGSALLEAELAGLADHHAGVDPPHLSVFLAVSSRLELEDGDAGLLAVAGHEAQVGNGSFG